MSLVGFADSRQSPDEVLASGEYPLTRRDLMEVAAMIYADAGISLNETKASLVYSRLSKHIRHLGISGFREYCQLVASPAGASARREMLSHLTTNFTRFFRENHHFDHLRTDVLPGLLARAKAGGRVRIWSAASSDGQDPSSYNELNLMAQWPFKGNFDVIFCRNVVIYFDEPTQVKIWQRFAGLLPEKGHLYIGHSERVSGPAKDVFDNIGITTYRYLGKGTGRKA
jgi:chemotaxis methyl-accepting protein methylase